MVAVTLTLLLETPQAEVLEVAEEDPEVQPEQQVIHPHQALPLQFLELLSQLAAQLPTRF